MGMDQREILVSAFRERFNRQPRWVGGAPGRVNLIGEHTDYNDGFVLPVAIDRTTLVAAAPSVEPYSRVLSLDLQEETVIDSSQLQGTDGQSWASYVIGVAWSFQQAGCQIPPLDVAISSRVPIGAGLSSSAALEVAIATVFAAASGRSVTPVEIALIAHRAENQFVAVPCGIMDQFIACLGIEGSGLLIDCRTYDYRPVPLELDRHGLSLVVVDSGVSRKLAASAYAERRSQCERAVWYLKRLLSGDIRNLRDVTEGDLLSCRDKLPRILFDRARHVISENARVLRCVDAFQKHCFDEVGSLLVQSHRSLRDDFEVSTPELDLLVELSLRTHGVLGARLTGAGFGGCTVNLMETSSVEKFSADVLSEYQAKTGITALMYVCHAANGARLI